MFYCWQRFRNVGTVGNELATMIPHSKFARSGFIFKEMWVEYKKAASPTGTKIYFRRAPWKNREVRVRPPFFSDFHES